MRALLQTQLVATVAALVRDRVLVVGSLPPSGRDLDLLVRPTEAEAIASGLERQSFERRGNVFAHFSGCRAGVVDVSAAAAWGLPLTELKALFARALPIESSGKICRPAPEHALLILARRAVREGPILQAQSRERIALELESDPSAFENAAARASAWGARRSLAALERAHRAGHTLSFGDRRRAFAEEFARSRSRSGGRIEAWRAVLRRPRKGPLLTVSATDPAVASRHAEDLAATLDLLGFTAVVARLGPAGARSAGSALAFARASWSQRLRGKVVVCGSDTPAPLPLTRPTWVGVVPRDRPPEQVCAELARSAWAAIS